MSVFRSYGPDELADLADRYGGDVTVATSGERTGVALPEWVHAGLVVSTEQARRLAAQLLLACDEHDAIQESAFQIPPIVEESGDALTTLRNALHRTTMTYDRVTLAHDGEMPGDDAFEELREAVAAYIGERAL